MDTQSYLSIIQINSITPGSKEITNANLKDIKNINHVISIDPWIQHDLDITNSEDWPNIGINPGAIWATNYIPERLPKILKGTKPKSLLENEIILPNTVPGGTLAHLFGRTIEFGYTVPTGPNHGIQQIIKLKVVGIYDNSAPNFDGEMPSYVSWETMTALYSNRLPNDYLYAYIQVDSSQNAAWVQQQISQLGFSVSGSAVSLEKVTGILGILLHTNKLFLPGILLITLLFGSYFGSTFLKERRRNLALLRTIGWNRTDIVLLTSAQCVLLTVTASFLGITLGSVLTTMIKALCNMQSIQLEYVQNVNPLNIVLILQLLLVAILGTILGTIPTNIRLFHTAPDQLLRD